MNECCTGKEKRAQSAVYRYEKYFNRREGKRNYLTMLAGDAGKMATKKAAWVFFISYTLFKFRSWVDYK